jgi:hypothetical protein
MSANSGENVFASGGAPHHDEAESFSNSPPSENPIADPFNVIVSVPEAIKIKMVDASALADYEVWVFIASILSNAVVGFLVAYSQALDANSPSAPYVGWTAVIFALLFMLSTITAFKKRSSLQEKGREIKLKTTTVSLR